MNHRNTWDKDVWKSKEEKGCENGGFNYAIQEIS